jgi:hypothetical protein
MFPRLVVSSRHPFAPSALPDFLTTMGVSDFRQPPPSSSFSRLVRGCAPPGAPIGGSPWLPHILPVRLDATSDPGVSSGTRHSAPGAVACWVRDPIGQTQRCRFRDSTSSGSASPATFAPRLLSHLRIKRPVTKTPARLDTRPEAISYLDGTCTH